MSDSGKLPRPETTAETRSSSDGERRPVLEGAEVTRRRTADELAYRTSGGTAGVAPMQRLMDERTAMGAQLAGRIQRKAEGQPRGGVAMPEGGGSGLTSQQRQRFEPKLGADLSDVRVHTGGASAHAAAGLSARAFTVGNDIHFNSGEFAPGAKEGDRLLAHELTHVVQGKKTGVQRKADEHSAAGDESHGAAGQTDVSHPDEPAEKEADAVADGVTKSLHEKSSAGGEHAKATGADAAKGPKEAPAPIAAKFIGVGTKIFRAKDQGAPAAGGPNAAAPDKASLKVDAKAEPKADPPLPTAASRDAGAWGAYGANWSGLFLPKLKENGISEATIASLAAKKSAWFEDAYSCVEMGKDHHPSSIESSLRFPRSRKGKSGTFGRAADQRRAWPTKRSRTKARWPRLRVQVQVQVHLHLQAQVRRMPVGERRRRRCGSRRATSESCSMASSINRPRDSTGRNRPFGSGSARRRTMPRRRPET